jgi:hypothetical protein
MSYAKGGRNVHDVRENAGPLASEKCIEGQFSILFSRACRLSGGSLRNRFERFTFFKPPALPEVLDSKLKDT